jgi:peroxiredoxin Q/BCP
VRSRPLLVLALLLAVPGLARAGGPAVGDLAPDFALQGSDGEVHRLSDLRGERAVVLAWFPKAFTSGCTLECRSLAHGGDAIRSFDVAYFMASVDAPEDNAGFAKSEQADFPLLSDPTQATAKAYGVLDASGVARRWTFYIGVDGRILAIDTHVAPATAAQDIAARLAQLGVKRRPEAPND